MQSYLCGLVHGLRPDAWEPLLDAAQEAIDRLAKAQPLDSIAHSDAEEELGSWLDKRRVPEGWHLAGTFVDAGLDIPWMERVVAAVPPDVVADALAWIEARLNLKMLLTQVEQSAGRVSEIVKAVKSYTHMDKGAMEEIDIHEGLESTLTVLGHKLKGVCVKRRFDRSIPRVLAYGGELNQV